MVVFEKGKTIQIAPYDRNFANKGVSARFKTILAGPSMNFVLAIVLFFFIGLVTGFPVLDSSVVTGIKERTPISEAGLKDGDEITKIGSFDIAEWEDISTAMAFYRNQYETDLQITYIRNGQVFNTTVTPQVLVYSSGIVSDFKVTDQVLVGKINPKTIVGKAGLLEGDEITQIKIDSVTTIVANWQDVIDVFLANTTGKEVEITVLRDSETEIIKFEPYDQEILDAQGLPMARLQLGVSPENEFNFGKSFVYGFTGTAGAFTFIFDTLRLLITNSRLGLGDLSGPLGILDMTTEVSKNGIISLLNWTALLSVNVGFVNLLPIPALDGSRLAFLGVEAISKKPANRKIENIIHTVGLMMLLLLFVFISWNDLLRVIGVK
jgi:regulator of sigma E protease